MTSAPIDDTTPRFTLAEAESLLHLRFELKGTLAPLPSERDQNFSIHTASGEKFVLKIAKSDERHEVLDRMRHHDGKTGGGHGLGP